MRVAAQTGSVSRSERPHASVQQTRVVEGQCNGHFALTFFAVLLTVPIVSTATSILLHTHMA